MKRITTKKQTFKNKKHKTASENSIKKFNLFLNSIFDQTREGEFSEEQLFEISKHLENIGENIFYLLQEIENFSARNDIK